MFYTPSKLTPHPPSTGSPDEGKLCILNLDGQGRVLDLIYIGKDPVEPRNLSCLVGMQEAYLNSCLSLHKR